ncbi:MAG: FHA domain-containing protein [Nitrosomonas sp.]|nr:FHA domain-containing protein [Nitrosomonas sp.]
MQDETDHTVMMRPEVTVSLINGSGVIMQTFSFSHAFTAGRAPDNDIVIADKLVSRHHLEIKYQSKWIVYDLNSANGVYIKNQRIKEKVPLNLPAVVALSKSGPYLEITPQGQCNQPCLHESLENEQSNSNSNSNGLSSTPSSRTSSVQKNYSKAELRARLLSKSDGEDFGHYTRMVRKIIHEDRADQKKSYKKLIWSLSTVFLMLCVLIAYQQISLSNARNLAIDMFYDIKTLEVSLSQSEIRLNESGEILELTIKAILDKKLAVDQQKIVAEQQKIEAERKLVAKKRQKLNEMKARYQNYVNEAKAFSFSFSNKSQYENDLILKVARGFGESELELPDGFIAEVKRYIDFWKRSERLYRAMAHLETLGYSPLIINALSREGLPLYFAYLPLQESNYDTNAIGPETRFGIAKGAWQFLPNTGREFGLRPGPLAHKPKFDEHDDRFNFEQATHAGAKYLKYLYSTEAQASGLLVLASYNYGQTRIRQALNQMPDNPRDRNFWKFIQQFELPKETYDYVLLIFSAAVIGEDPLHFGFGFKPLLN